MDYRKDHLDLWVAGVGREGVTGQSKRGALGTLEDSLSEFVKCIRAGRCNCDSNKGIKHTFPLRQRGKLRLGCRGCSDSRRRGCSGLFLRVSLASLVLHYRPPGWFRWLRRFFVSRGRGRGRLNSWPSLNIIDSIQTGVSHSEIVKRTGFQSGVYSPPAPCFDLTAINSAISLRNHDNNQR